MECHGGCIALQSAVVNLALNSRDAMPEGGKLTIEVGNAARSMMLTRSAYAEVELGQYVLFSDRRIRAGG